jgi:hypothetical protein
VAEPLWNNYLPQSGDYGKPDEPAVISLSWRNADNELD